MEYKKGIKCFIMKNKKGASSGIYIYGIFIIYIFAIFSILFGKIYMIITNGNRVKETMKEACIYVMTSNWDELFHSIKEGYAGGYNYKGEELIDEERVYNIMQKELETIRQENTFIKLVNNTDKVVYKYYDIEMTINNTGYKNVNDSYSIDLKLTFEAPLELLFMNIPIKVDLKSKAKWIAKY